MQIEMRLPQSLRRLPVEWRRVCFGVVIDTTSCWKFTADRHKSKSPHAKIHFSATPLVRHEFLERRADRISKQHKPHGVTRTLHLRRVQQLSARRSVVLTAEGKPA